METLKNQKLMDACIKRANEIINERMNAWKVDEFNMGAAEKK